MNPYRTYAVLLGIFSMLFPSCQKENHSSDNCGVYDSRIARVGYSTNGKDYTWDVFSWDSQKRLEKIEYAAGGSVTWSYLSDSLHSYKQIFASGSYLIAYRKVDSNRRVVETVQYLNADTSYVTKYVYSYGSDGQLQNGKIYYTPKGRATYLGNSADYTWENGNVTKIQDTLLGYKSVIEYDKNSVGWNYLNMPQAIGDLVYNPATIPIVSKNFFSKITREDNTGTTVYNDVQFDKQGRVTSFTITTYAGGTTTKKYQVIEYTCL